MNTTPTHPDRWKNITVFLTVLATVIAAAVAGLQADANIRANRANRESQLYAIQAFGELQRVGLQGDYEMATLLAVGRDLNESIKFQLLVVERLGAGDQSGADLMQLQADTAQARSNSGQSLSVLYTDPRYKPDSSGTPNWQLYLDDLHAGANDLVAKQNQATDMYNLWSRKADNYVVVLTVLTVALFLFGLAQAMTPRLRLLFSLFGTLVTSLAVLGTLLIMIF